MSIDIYRAIKCALHPSQYAMLQSHVLAQGVSHATVFERAYQALECHIMQTHTDNVPWHALSAPLSGTPFEAHVPEPLAEAAISMSHAHAYEVSDVWYTALTLYMALHVKRVEVNLTLPDELARMCRTSSRPNVLDEALDWYFHTHDDKPIMPSEVPSSPRMAIWTTYLASHHAQGVELGDMNAQCQHALSAYFAIHPIKESGNHGLCLLDVSDRTFRTVRFLMWELQIKSVAALYERATTWWLHAYSHATNSLMHDYYARPRRKYMLEDSWNSLNMTIPAGVHRQIADVARTESQTIRTVYYTILIDFMHHTLRRMPEHQWILSAWHGIED